MALGLSPGVIRLSGSRGGTRVLICLATGPTCDLAVHLVGEFIELVLGAAEGFGPVSEDGLGRTLDALSQLLDARSGVMGGAGGLLGDPGVNQLLGRLEGLGDLLLVRLPDGVKEVLGEERLGVLGFLGRVPHPIEELVELLGLLLGPLAGLLAVFGLAQRMLGILVPVVELLGEFLLVLVEPAGLVAHLGHRLGELVRRCLAELLAEVVQLLAGPAPSVRAWGSRPSSRACEA